MDFLIAHPYVGSSLETAGDLALQLTEQGYEVGFIYIDVNDPADPLPWGIKPLTPKKQRKAKNIYRILRSRGINCIDITDFEYPDFYIPKLSSVDELKIFEYKNYNIGRGVLSDLIVFSRDAYPDVDDYIGQINQSICASIKAYELLCYMLQKYLPKIVLTFNGRQAVPSAISNAADFLNIPIKYYEAGATPERFFLNDQKLHDFNYRTFLIKEYWKNAQDGDSKAIEHFEARRNCCLHDYNYAQLQKQGKIPSKIKPKRITFFSSSEDEIQCLDIDAISDKSKIFVSQRESIEFLINWVKNQSDIELIIRIHPNVANKCKKDQDYWHNLSGENVTLIDAMSTVDSYALMESSDIVITYGSSIGLEATYWGIPSILLMNGYYSGFEAAYEPDTKEELISLLTSDLVALPKKNTFPPAYFIGYHGNYTYKYLNPVFPYEKRKFCGKHLSTEHLLIRYLKKTFLKNVVLKTRIFST